MEFNLKRILKSLLFSTSEPLSIKDIQAVITRFHEESDKWKPEEKEAEEPVKQTEDESGQGVMQDVMDQVPTLLTATHIREAMDEITRDFEEADEVIRLVQGPRGYQIACAPTFSDWVRLLRGEARPTRLSRAAMETLAVISYRQPVTRAEIEAIRGVSSDSAVTRLLEHELIEVQGRADLPGRPIQYGTTETFLEFVGVKTVEELPASDVLSDRQIDDWLKESGEEEEISDKDMGLPSEEASDETGSETEPETDTDTATTGVTEEVEAPTDIEDREASDEAELEHSDKQ